MLTPHEQLQLFYEPSVDRVEQVARDDQVQKSPPNDETSTHYGKDRVFGAARRLGRVLVGDGRGPIRSLTNLARRAGLRAGLVACALACRPLPDGTPGAVVAGLVEVQIGTLYRDPAVPAYPEAVIVVRPTTGVPGVQTKRGPAFGITRGREQSFYTAFAHAVHGEDNRLDYAVAIGAVLSPAPYDHFHPPSDPDLAPAITHPAHYLALHFGYVARRIDALRGDRGIDPAWLIAENRIALKEEKQHSKTASETETLARQPGFGQAFREQLGDERTILIHVSDERSGGKQLFPTLRYQPPDSHQRLSGAQLNRALSDPRDPAHAQLQDAVWAWGPDLPDGVATKVMGGELIDVRTDERFVLVVANAGYGNVYLAMPFTSTGAPRLTQLRLLQIALAVRAWMGDSPTTGRQRRRSVTYHQYVNVPARDPYTRTVAFFGGAIADTREKFDPPQS